MKLCNAMQQTKNSNKAKIAKKNHKKPHKKRVFFRSSCPLVERVLPFELSFFETLGCDMGGKNGKQVPADLSVATDDDAVGVGVGGQHMVHRPAVHLVTVVKQDADAVLRGADLGVGAPQLALRDHWQRSMSGGERGR